MIHQLIIGMIGGAVVATLAMDLGWLRDGRAAIAAVLVGGTIFGFSGIAGALLLIAFFASSSLLSKLPAPGHRRPGGKAWRKAGGPIVQKEPGSAGQKSRRQKPRRTARQVAANGLVIVAAAIVYGVAVEWGVGDVTVGRMILAGAIAAATADTWATEVGNWWGATPRSAVTGRVMARGESGGITPAGTLAAMMGAAWIGLVSYWIWPDFTVQQAFMIEAAGLAGMWVDSALGATLQFKATCPECGQLVEDPAHPHPVESPRGLRFLGNDAVNVLGIAAGALVAMVLVFTL